MNFLKRSPRPSPYPASPSPQAPSPASPSPQTPRPSGSSDDYLLYIHSICPTTNISEGECLLENQTAVDNLYVIVGGSLHITIATQYSSYNIKMSKGALFGFVPDNKEHKICYTIKSTSSSVIIVVSKRTFDNFSSDIKYKIYELLSRTFSSYFTTTIYESHFLSGRNSQLISYIHSMHNKNKEKTSSDLIQSVIQKIPKIPSHAHNILSRLMSEEISAQELTESIQKDPALVGVILKTVNSSYYGLSQKISDIHHAIMYLGFNNIYQLILTHITKSIVDNDAEFSDIQLHSTLISFISHHISTVSKKSKPMTIMASGLLHEIGKSVIILMKHKNPPLQDLFDLLDDAAIGASLLQSWELPEQIFLVVKNQHVPEFCPPEHLHVPYKEDLAILYVAHVYHDLLLDTPPISTLYLNEYLALLGAPPNDSVQFYAEGIRSALLKNLTRLPVAARTILQDKLSVPKLRYALGAENS